MPASAAPVPGSGASGDEDIVLGAQVYCDAAARMLRS